MTGARTIDPLPRTVLAWQRTLAALTMVAIGLAFAAMRQGMGAWVVPALLAALAPLPLALRRERELLQDDPRLLRPRVASLLTGSCLVLAAVGFGVVLLA